MKKTLKLQGTITNSSSSSKRPGTYTHVAMDSANGKLDPSVYGELGCPKTLIGRIFMSYYDTGFKFLNKTI